MLLEMQLQQKKKHGYLYQGKKTSQAHFILVSKSTFRHQALAEKSIGKGLQIKDKPNSYKPAPQQAAKGSR